MCLDPHIGKEMNLGDWKRVYNDQQCTVVNPYDWSVGVSGWGGKSSLGIITHQGHISQVSTNAESINQ